MSGEGTLLAETKGQYIPFSMAFAIYWLGFSILLFGALVVVPLVQLFATGTTIVTVNDVPRTVTWSSPGPLLSSAALVTLFPLLGWYFCRWTLEQRRQGVVRLIAEPPGLKITMATGDLLVPWTSIKKAYRHPIFSKILVVRLAGRSFWANQFRRSIGKRPARLLVDGGSIWFRGTRDPAGVARAIDARVASAPMARRPTFK